MLTLPEQVKEINKLLDNQLEKNLTHMADLQQIHQSPPKNFSDKVA